MWVTLGEHLDCILIVLRMCMNRFCIRYLYCTCFVWISEGPALDCILTSLRMAMDML